MEKQYIPDKEKEMPRTNVNAPVTSPVKNEKTEAKPEEVKAETKEVKKQEKVKREEASLLGKDLPISTKHSMAICNFIRGKKIEDVIPELEKVAKLRKAIPMRGEIPHRKGKGMMSGRYPVNASKVFIRLLKSLNANASANGIENACIITAVPNKASRPHKRGGRERFKRTNVMLIAREKRTQNQDKAQKIKQETKKN